ncbi:hypothetical protein ACHAXR_005793 [Thalassiosira sp. AJA248-18]
MPALYKKDLQTGEWTYPSSEDVLEEVGLHTIKQYIEVRRQTVAAYIVDRPIFGFCRNGERMRGTSPRLLPLVVGATYGLGLGERYYLNRTCNHAVEIKDE